VLIASPFNFEVELKNFILVALQDFEFSHGLGPKAKCGAPLKRSACQGRPEIAEPGRTDAIDPTPTS
jgi:hypothetical protein